MFLNGLDPVTDWCWQFFQELTGIGTYCQYLGTGPGIEFGEGTLGAPTVLSSNQTIYLSINAPTTFVSSFFAARMRGVQ